MYYPCSENKGADQLRGYREADLRLCFRIGKNQVFSRCGSFNSNRKTQNNLILNQNADLGFVTAYPYMSHCQNSSKFLSSQYFMKTTYQIVI